MDAIVVEARRNGIVEARHRVHAVAVQDGAVVAEAGKGGTVCFLRSSSKPLQALPLARARDDLDDADLAIASASHRATAEQLEAVRGLLAKAGATEDDLELGLQPDRPPTKLHHNCSGKHAGMLALCRAHGWPTAAYVRADHPAQQAMLAVHAEAAGASADELPAALDGCGVQTFALPLERMAFAFSRLEQLEGGARVAAAMRARPELVGGPDGPDYELMRLLPGWIAKSGAEGLICAAGPGGLGVVLKTADGGLRAHRPALASFLGTLGHELAGWSVVTVENSRGEVVGSLSAAA
ncbi:MAG: asparaginase [Gaiellaceae bacterium]